MVESDTIELLKECGAGVKMGSTSIGEVLDKVQSGKLRDRLSKYMEEHQTLGSEIHKLLNRYHDSVKEPNPMAKGMSWFRTNVVLSLNGGDSAVADFVTDGCNMGVKSLSKYMNKYKAADEDSKDIAKRLVGVEEKLAADVREYL